MGLLDEQGPEQTPVPTGPQPPQPGAEIEPWLQEQVDMVMANGMAMIHDEKISDGFIRKITSAKDPLDEIANATLMVINRLKGDADEKGFELHVGHLAPIANGIMGEIINQVELSGMEPLTEEDKVTAYDLAVAKYLNNAVQTGEITKEELGKWGLAMQQTPEGQKIVEAGGGGQPPETGLPPEQPTGSGQPILAGGV